MFFFVKTGCPQHKYDLTDCSNKCPRCLNGGVCSDVDGDCICPPGFGGKICGEGEQKKYEHFIAVYLKQN